MMFWFTVRPAIKEFANRLLSNPEQFRWSSWAVGCRETATRLDVTGSYKFESLFTRQGTLFPRHLSFSEKRLLQNAFKKGKAKEAYVDINRVINTINPEKLVKEND